MGTDPDKPPEPPRRGPPTPVREGATPPPRGSRPERGGAPPSGPPEAADAPAPTATEPDVEERVVDIDGSEWTVRLRGRAGVGASVRLTSTIPLLLVSFVPGAGEGVAEREALVVGRTLSALTPDQLDQAFRRSTPQLSRAEGTAPGSHAGRGGR